MRERERREIYEALPPFATGVLKCPCLIEQTHLWVKGSLIRYGDSSKGLGKITQQKSIMTTAKN